MSEGKQVQSIWNFNAALNVDKTQENAVKKILSASLHLQKRQRDAGVSEIQYRKAWDNMV